MSTTPARPKRSKRPATGQSKPDLCDLAEAGAAQAKIETETDPKTAALARQAQSRGIDMSLVTKLLGIIKGGAKLESGIAGVVLHLSAGDKKGAISEMLTLLEGESDGHPAVKNTLLEIQGDLATIGLAAPVPAPPAPAPAAAPIPVAAVAPVVVPVAEAPVQVQPAAAPPAA